MPSCVEHMTVVVQIGCKFSSGFSLFELQIVETYSSLPADALGPLRMGKIVPLGTCPHSVLDQKAGSNNLVRTSFCSHINGGNMYTLGDEWFISPFSLKVYC